MNLADRVGFNPAAHLRSQEVLQAEGQKTYTLHHVTMRFVQ